MTASLAAILAAPAAAESPTVTTEAASNLTATKATLNAKIDTHGKYTSYAFEYGTTTKYGSYTEAADIPAGATSPVHVTARLEGLQLETTYHFRIWALGGGKAVSGKDVTFKTLPGLYLTGEESEEEASQPRIASTKTQWVFAEVSSGSSFTLLQGPEMAVGLECDGGEFFAGYISPSEPMSSFSLTPGAFTECELEENPTTVKMNGCQYVYSLANVGPPYSGSVEEIKCASGKAIEAVVAGLCTLKIPAQALKGSVSYEESNYEEELGAVEAEASGGGVAFEKVAGSGSWCFLFKNGTGTFNGSITLF